MGVSAAVVKLAELHMCAERTVGESTRLRIVMKMLKSYVGPSELCRKIWLVSSQGRR